jgi:hypothetical protein
MRLQPVVTATALWPVISGKRQFAATKARRFMGSGAERERREGQSQ